MVLTAELRKKRPRRRAEDGEDGRFLRKDGQMRRLGLVELGEAEGWHLAELQLEQTRMDARKSAGWPVVVYTVRCDEWVR